MKYKLFSLFVIILLLVTTLATAQSSPPNRIQNRVSSFSSTSSSSYTSHQYRPNYETYYGSNVKEYWPILGDRDVCEGRQDLIINVAPFGCTPAVVRSDLLAEQNVPVFCQLDAAKINPLIDINQIKSVRFSGDYPEEIAGVGFHPAKAALRTKNTLLGSPLINNIGYIVVILKRQEVESKLPNNVNLTLSAQVEYVSGNAYGIGKTEFALEKVPENEWNTEKLRNSFWNGRYFVRLEEVDPNFADVSIYNGDRKIVTTRVERGKTSRDLYLPGMYCRAGLQITYEGYTSAENKARIEVSSSLGTDAFDVYEGSRIYDSCSISNIDVNPDGKTGLITGSCEGERFELVINSSNNSSLSAPAQNDEAEKYYQEAIKYYEQVASDFPNEPPKEIMNNNANSQKYGEEALINAITLAETFGKKEDKRNLINKYLENYPESSNSQRYLAELEKIEDLDFSKASIVVDFDDRTRVIRLVSLGKPKNEASADLLIEGKRENVKLDETLSLFGGSVFVGNLTLDSVDAEQVRVSGYCLNDRGRTSARETKTLKINTNPEPICGIEIKLDNTNGAEIAKIKLTPVAEGTQTATNFSVNIGIEKRDIQLAPDKAQEKIGKLEEDIKDWEEISDKLGNVVTGLKSACFGVSAALTFKNLLTGLSGEALARQQVMNGPNGWKAICGDDDACYLKNADTINKDVALRKGAIQKVNDQVKNTQANFTSEGGIFGLYGKNVDTKNSNAALARYAREKYKTTTINLGDKQYNGKNIVTVNELFSEENINNDTFTQDQIREVMIYSELQGKGLSESQEKNLNSNAVDNVLRIGDSKSLREELAKQDQARQEGWGSINPVSSSTQTTRAMDVVKISNENKNIFPQTDITHASRVFAPTTTIQNKEGTAALETFSGTYVLGLHQINAVTGEYAVREIYDKETGTYLSEEQRGLFLGKFGIGNIKSSDRVSYSNEIAQQDQVVKFYETEPYKGMPAIVPFNVREGWYAATRQTLPAFGGIGAFDASGRVSSFWLCNVGENKRVEFESGLGDDICQQINLNTGQPLGYFPGLDESKARTIVNQAIASIEEAARQYGNKVININSQRLQVGKPAVNIPGTQCQDFMSPKDCHLMFNVCDPVICPSSRCDFGGKFPVANVAQTGIAGSALLCLPNIKEGIVIPVCLTGIKSGIDGLLSIMRNYRDCLKENVETGRLVGICDQIYSVYMCDFFWGQVAPFANVLIPRLLETFYGQGTRGGAEYLTVNAAWQNMENSVDYFTQSYAVNSLRSFQARTGTKFGGSDYILEGGISEIGSQFCDSFISAKAPNALKSLVEPDSPPQFHAWFDSKTFSSATVPATAQYKVFYHIYAGNDEGVYFNVYLKNPPESSYYAVASNIQVESGFVPKGGYASQTRDFTAPEGYQELCVRINNEEECGFKQVSTSFAINQIRDSYIKDQALENNIQSEKECVSGTRDARTMLTPNLQSGIEETAFPEAYNRGIIRICSSRNPGLTTDPTRFVDSGHCGDQKIRCWLDKNSVDNAITNNNVGVLNETLEELEKRDLNDLIANEQLWTEDAAKSEIDKIKQTVQKLDESSSKLADAIEISSTISAAEPKLFLNYQKAQLILLKAQVNDKIAVSLLVDRQKQQRVTTPSSIPGTPTQPSQPIGKSITLKEKYQKGKYIGILIDGRESRYYINGNEISILDPAAGAFIPIGEVITNDGQIGIFGNPEFEKYKELDGNLILGFSEIPNPKEIKWNYDLAIAEAERREGKYSDFDNEDFVNALYNQNLLTEDQYDEIDGNLFGGEEDMDYVSRALQVNKIKTDDRFRISSGSIYFESEYTGLGINGRDIVYNREKVGSISSLLNNLDMGDQTTITIEKNDNLNILGKFTLGNLNGKRIINTGGDIYKFIEDFEEQNDKETETREPYSVKVLAADNKLYIYLGDKRLPLYIDGDKIYAEIEEDQATSLVGTIVGDRLNTLPDRVDSSSDIYTYLSDLKDKSLEDLKSKRVYSGQD